MPVETMTADSTDGHSSDTSSLKVSKTTDGEPVLSLENVEVGHSQGNPLLVIPSLELSPGEIVSIVGPSGIGKTTILRTLAGIINPISGIIRVCKANPPDKPTRGAVGYIPQRLGLVRHASVWHNVMLGARAGHSTKWQIFNSDAHSHAKSAIESMGLVDKVNEPIRRLSGGEQRRVATARTLAQCPELILADEFLSELDEETMESVVSEVIRYIRSNGRAMILVEHDVSRAKQVSDRVLLVDDGRLNPFISGTIMVEA